MCVEYCIASYMLILQSCFSKVLKKAEKLYSSIHIDFGTSINERFHAHLRFYCIKGDSMSTDHWHLLVLFAFLSFNNYPNWQQKVIDAFVGK
jgi:hypothetical protein